MAVSFKVPSSPRKDIFQIENFMGVDFTNTGSSIDEVRSPNAENMVRFVPGKVRKRTGYTTQVEFSSGTDVNRVKNSPNEWKTIDVTATTLADANTICELYDTIPRGTTFCVDIKVRAVGSYRMSAKPSSFGWNISGTEEEPYNRICYSLNGSTSGGDFNLLSVYRTSEASENDYFEVKDIKVYWKTSATTSTELHDIKWELAPEETGHRFIRTEKDSVVNGVHKLELGNVNGNRIVNQNRCQNHSNSQWITISDGNFGYTYEFIPGGQTINVRFEYKDIVLTEGESYMTFDFGTFSAQIEGTSGTFNETIVLEAGGNEHMYVFNGGSITIKNLMITYESDGTVEWQEAPEKHGEVFNIDDMYLSDSTNYAMSNVYQDNYQGTIRIRSVTKEVQAGYSHVDGGLWHISFTADANSIASPSLVPTTGNESIRYFIRLTSSDNQFKTYQLTDALKNHEGKEFSFYLDCADDWYISNFTIDIRYDEETEIDFKCKVYNFKLQKVSIRPDYTETSDVVLYHVGTNLFEKKSSSEEYKLISSNMNNIRSSSWQIGNFIYLIDGKRYRRYNGTTLELEDVESVAYIPTVTIAKEHDGGGVTNEPFNMLQPGFIETFYGDGTSTSFQLSLNGLDGTSPSVWVMDSEGNFQEKTLGTDFSFGAIDGVVTFTTAPSESPLTGEPNVKIQAYKTIGDYAERINKCTIGTFFGVNGASDRLFFSGNPDHKNWDFFSEQYDPTYFPDTGYSQLGLETSAIVGYSKVNNYLATHKDERETEQNVLVREGDLITRKISYGDKEFEFSEPAFKLINTIQGAGAYGKHTFGSLSTEPIFLTKSGLYAITPQDLTGEKYGQNRSFFLNGKLLKEENLNDAYSTIYNDMYILAVNDKLYILDGLQPVQTDKSMPYATRQYVGFYCTNVPANIIYTQDDALWIGTKDGKICKFATDIEDLNSYNDDGKPIYCCWETPDLDGKLFYKNKTFRYFAIRMMKALRTSVECYYNRNGNWAPDPFKIDASSGIVFDFNHIDFSAFSFSTNNSEKVVHSKVKVKKVDKAKFKIENKVLNEPLGLLNLALEYVESGNYKG